VGKREMLKTEEKGKQDRYNVLFDFH